MCNFNLEIMNCTGNFHSNIACILFVNPDFILKKEAEFSIFEYIKTFYNTKRRYTQPNNLIIIKFYQSIINNLKNAD